MGVDIGIKIRMLDENDNIQSEIPVSDQDNSLGSIFEGAGDIRYTSLSLSDGKIISGEDFELVKFIHDPEEEMMMASKIIDSKEALKIFDKIWRSTYRKLSQALEVDIAKIDNLEIEQEQKSKRRESKMSDYIGFEYSLGVAIGILKVAAESYPKVQIIGEYY